MPTASKANRYRRQKTRTMLNRSIGQKPSSRRVQPDLDDHSHRDNKQQHDMTVAVADNLIINSINKNAQVGVIGPTQQR